MKYSFDKGESLKLKGIAIILMLIHHTFPSDDVMSNQFNISISYAPFYKSDFLTFSLCCKICVSLFAFISGYGLFLNYQNNQDSAQKWVIKRYIKSFSGYWFVWIFSSLICQLIDGRTARVMFSEGTYKGIIYSVISFLGLSRLFNTPSINGTWWYMSAVVVFILLIPLLFKCKDNLFIVLAGIIVFIRLLKGQDACLGGQSPYTFLTPFVCGCIFARYNYFEQWVSYGNNKWIQLYKFLTEIYIIILMYKMYNNIPASSFWEYHFGLFPLAIIMLCIEYIFSIKALGNVLMFLGKHSMNIFLIHTFIRIMYLRDFTYSFKHFTGILMVLLLISILASYIVEWIKKVSGYNSLIERLCSKIL